MIKTSPRYVLVVFLSSMGRLLIQTYVATVLVGTTVICILALHNLSLRREMILTGIQILTSDRIQDICW